MWIGLPIATAVAERKRQKVWLENRWWVLHQQMFKRLCAHDFDLLLSIILRQSTVCIHHHSSSTLASSTFVFVLVPSTLQHSLTVNSLHSSAFIRIHLHSAIWTSVCLASPPPTPGNRSPTMVSRVLVEAPLRRHARFFISVQACLVPVEKFNPIQRTLRPRRAKFPPPHSSGH